MLLSEPVCLTIFTISSTVFIAVASISMLAITIDSLVCIYQKLKRSNPNE